jgi:hypothetical protein
LSKVSFKYNRLLVISLDSLWQISRLSGSLTTGLVCRDLHPKRKKSGKGGNTNRLPLDLEALLCK